MAKVKVTNNSNQHITLIEDSINFRATFEKRGVSRFIDSEVLQQLMYASGVERMFKQGVLVIDEMSAKIELGLEPEGAKEPVNIIVLTDAQKRRYLTVAPLKDLIEIVEKLPFEQVKELARFAIANELVGSIEKTDFLKEKTGIDILKGIQLNKEDKLSN